LPTNSTARNACSWVRIISSINQLNSSGCPKCCGRSSTRARPRPPEPRFMSHTQHASGSDAHRLERSGGDGRAAAERCFHASDDLLCVLNWDGEIQCANPAWVRVMGEPQPGSGRCSLLELAHQDDGPMLASLFDGLRPDSAPLWFESRCGRPDGS